MKVIDVLNKIANGEEIPKKIKYNGTIYEKFDYNNKYYDVENNTREKDILSEHLASQSFYNDEVEIIEEDKKIEFLPMIEEDAMDIDYLAINQTRRKINEIIDYLNKEE